MLLELERKMEVEVERLAAVIGANKLVGVKVSLIS